MKLNVNWNYIKAFIRMSIKNNQLFEVKYLCTHYINTLGILQEIYIEDIKIFLDLAKEFKHKDIIEYLETQLYKIENIIDLIHKVQELNWIDDLPFTSQYIINKIESVPDLIDKDLLSYMLWNTTDFELRQYLRHKRELIEGFKV